MLDYALMLAFPVAMAFAAMFDLFTMTIPNRISIALIVLFVVAAVVTRMPLHEVGLHLAVGLGALVILFFMFSRGWLGGGDAKLWAVAALWMGPTAVVNYTVAVGLLGGLLALAILSYRQMALPGFMMSLPWAQRLHSKDCGIPYGIALAAAAIWVYPSSPWIGLLTHAAV